jgi:hypothetical protein
MGFLPPRLFAQNMPLDVRWLEQHQADFKQTEEEEQTV